MAGLPFGTAPVAAAVISGPAAAALAAPATRGVRMAASVARLPFPAARIALAGSRIASAAPGLGAGVALRVIDPEARSVHMARFPDLPLRSGGPAVGAALVRDADRIPPLLARLRAGGSPRRPSPSPTVPRRIDRGVVAAMPGVAAPAARSAPRGPR